MRENAKPSLNWVNTSFLTLTPLLGFGGTVWLFLNHAILWPTLLLALFYAIATGLGITAGYHRLFSHQTYEAAWPLRLFYALFGLAAFEGSILEWCADHRRHHRFVDTEKDPYNIRQGFWHAHIGWLLYHDPKQRNFSNVNDLKSDPIVRLQHRFNIPLALGVGILAPTLLAGLWGDWVGGFFIAAMLRITLAQHLTFCINSVCHTFGKKTYSYEQTARDNWFTAFFTFGEGFHSFHHQFPGDFRNGIRLFDYDPTKWFIYTLSKMRITWGLRRVELKQIISAKLLCYEKYLSHPTECQKIKKYDANFFEPARAKVLSLLTRADKTRRAYMQLKKDAHRLKNKYLRTYYLRQRIYRQYMKRQERALSLAMAHLTHVMKKRPVMISS